MNVRLVRSSLAALFLAAFATACGHDSPTAPSPERNATRTADRFEHIADSLEAAGAVDGADATRAMAELVRTVGRVDQVTVSLDGRSASYGTIATELLTDASACDDTADPEFCHELNPEFMQLVIGWKDLDLSEGFWVITEKAGTSSVEYDETAGLLPGASVLYFKRDIYADPDGPFGVPSDAWLAEQGTVTTPVAVRGDACPNRDNVEPGLAYPCHRAAFSPSFDVTITSLDPAASTPAHLTMATQRVDGLSIDVTDVIDPSADALLMRSLRMERTMKAARVRGLLRRVAPVFGRPVVPR